ncbi:MAG: hypothetical protein WC830_23475 [Burkholderiales bacterium]|jgi:hypothetical protein
MTLVNLFEAFQEEIGALLRKYDIGDGYRFLPPTPHFVLIINRKASRNGSAGS